MKCPNCQSDNSPNAKFCNECGNRLIPPSEEPLPSALSQETVHRGPKRPPKGVTGLIPYPSEPIEGELRQVTIMFCDMKGFTPLSARIGPERTFSLMDKVFDIIIRRVNEYEGVVNELRGDGALVFFGAPIATEEAPVKALHCALAIQKGLNEFSKTIADDKDIPPVLFRIGINSGPVVVGFVGKDLRTQFTAQGDTVNVAARMEAIAEPGTIYVTEETYKITRATFHFESLGKIRVKGKRKPLQVYRLISAKGFDYGPHLVGVDRFPYSEMVGRDEELARLELQVMKAVSGEGSIVNIAGEAGIGKSRLLTELKRRDVMRWAVLLEGRATRIGRSLSFHPIIDLLRRWAGIIQQDTGSTAAYKLERFIQVICGEDLHDVLPFVATLMGVKLYGDYEKRTKEVDGGALRELIFKSVRELLGRAAEMNPLIFVMEDLHWADTSTIDMLESIHHLAEEKGILFLNFFRPGDSETENRIERINESFPKNSLQIELKALDQRTTERMVINMLPSIGSHHPLVAQIVRQTGGNPFFIEEVVQSLIDAGVVVRESDNHYVISRTQSLSVPSTVNDVLMARIDHLNEKTRKVLKLASVIGTSFFYRLLSDITGDIGDIDGDLYVLKQKQLIHESRATGEIEYRFNHPIAQEVAYRSILPEKRRALHRQVGKSIEKIFSHRIADFYGMLAYHYSKANDTEKTEEYLTKAGEEALRSSASAEALQYYQEALRIYLNQHGDTADPEHTAMLQKSIAISFYNRGQYEEAIAYFEKTLNYYSIVFPSSFFGMLTRFCSGFINLLLSIYWPALKFHREPTSRAIAVAEFFGKRCESLGIINPRRFFIESVYFCKEITKYDLNNFDLALKYFSGFAMLFSITGICFELSEKILNVSKSFVKPDNKKIYIIYDLARTIHDYAYGNWRSIPGYDAFLVDENLRLGEVSIVSQHLYWHGLPNIYTGNLDSCRSIISKLSEISSLYQNDFSLLLKYELNTILLTEYRQLDKAFDEVNKGIELAQRPGLAPFLFDLHSLRIGINILMGQMEEAEAAIAEAEEIKGHIKMFPVMLSTFELSRFHLFVCQMQASLAGASPEKLEIYKARADESRRRFLKISRKVAQHLTQFNQLCGVFYWLNDQPKKSLRCWQKAIIEGERLGARLELSRVYAEVGRRLIEPDSKYASLNDLGAEACLRKARELCVNMGLKQDLVRLDRDIAAHFCSDN